MRLRTQVLIAAVVLVGVVLFMRSPTKAGGGKFEPPDEKERRKAVGALDDLSPELMRAFDPSWGEPIARPGGNDWLAKHEESGQTFKQFQKSKANRPDAKRR